ncbi:MULTISPECIES: sulfite exporter TauE/SafE family protein [unclassified Paenibacillus]|uniref:sulfite exporter TauE/SafE family protein n=1 Tax=unclassified Paenibacillus TaxID=185978 RepID=UPI001AE80039|nr:MULTISPECIES: sulfite exporter TauE/SafE family protein [unclassified Paenibacillus]MBP1157042.1 putative membrane protein YfcA [Paenibacillus sp. PvP091]MBP1172219.1 putative membrane protein YfcA [Paenibacillus sp. PvR098]MBP2438600.1 putative membrane protein YfcA [Paenibacillus sp. PvP052]
MELDFGLIITLFAIGFIGSFISGMVGIGGAIIKYPMLLYIPPAFGLIAYTAQEVSAISAVQVFFATLAGIFAYRKGNFINKRLVLYMGVPIVIGSFIGGYGSKFLPDSAINLTYAIMALAAAIMMFLPKKGVESEDHSQLRFHVPIASISAVVVGTLSGIVGAAGAFITVPIMLVVLKIPTRVAIASSLAITFISSIGSTVGKVMGGHMLLIPSIVMVVASILASPIGSKVGQKMNVKVLQWILAGLITATVIKIWIDILT